MGQRLGARLPPYWPQLTTNSAAFERRNIAPVLTALQTLSGEIASVEAHPDAQGLLAATRPVQATLQQAATLDRCHPVGCLVSG